MPPDAILRYDSKTRCARHARQRCPTPRASAGDVDGAREKMRAYGIRRCHDAFASRSRDVAATSSCARDKS